MPESMDAKKLTELAGKVRSLLDEYDIDVEIFTLGIRVSSKYYSKIKANFPDRHEIDMIVGTSESNWAIQLMCSPFASSDDNKS